MSTEILGYFSETDFSLVSVDVFRPKGDWNTRFCSRNTFFSCFLYILDSFSTRYSWFSSFITEQVNVLWSCGFIQPITDFYRPFAKSMLHSVKSNKYKSYIFFTASINLFYYFPFLQSIDRWQFLFFVCFCFCSMRTVLKVLCTGNRASQVGQNRLRAVSLL